MALRHQPVDESECESVSVKDSVAQEGLVMRVVQRHVGLAPLRIHGRDDAFYPPISVDVVLRE